VITVSSCSFCVSLRIKITRKYKIASYIKLKVEENVLLLLIYVLKRVRCTICEKVWLQHLASINLHFYIFFLLEVFDLKSFITMYFITFQWCFHLWATLFSSSFSRTCFLTTMKETLKRYLYLLCLCICYMEEHISTIPCLYMQGV